MLWYRRATYKDILAIGPCLREADQREYLAASGLPAEAALIVTFLDCSMAWTVLLDTTPVAVFGLTKHGSAFSPWMCGTDLLRFGASTFLRGSKEILERILQVIDDLQGLIDSRNSVHIAWLEWMGFTIHRDCPVEIRGVPFYPFEYNTHV